MSQKPISFFQLPRAALRLPGAIIISSLQDFNLARSARKCPKLRVSDAGGPTRPQRQKRVEFKYKNHFDAAINQVPNTPQGQRFPKYIVQTMVKVGNDWKMEGLPRPNEESWEDEGEIEDFLP
jgi:hypothetical protein